MKASATQKKEKILSTTVLRTSVVVFLFLVGAKLLNFIKKILIGKLFGVSTVADAFFAASFLPYYSAIFFEGVIFLGFLPLFSQVMAEKGWKEAKQFMTEIFLLIAVLTSVLVGLGWWAGPWVIGQLVPGFSAQEQALTLSLFQVLSLVVVFISLTSFFKALNSYFEDYAWAASSGLVDALMMIGITLLTWKSWGIYGAAWGAVGGVATALLLQAVFLFRKRKFLPGRFVPQNSRLLKLFYFLIPMAIIWGFQQIPLVILNRFGSGMWEGTISALTISQTLTTVPMGLVSHTVLFAVFPTLAKQASNGASAGGAKETFFQTLRGGFLILVPVGFLMTALAHPVAALFFSGGGISGEGTRRIANSLTCFGWATFALYADLFMTQSLIAVRKTFPAILLSGSRAVLTYAVGYVLSIVWDYQGLAFSFSIALVVNLFFLFPIFFRMSPFTRAWAPLFRYTGKLALASSPLLLMGWLVNRYSILHWMRLTKLETIGFLGLGCLAGGGIYLLLLSWLKVDEMRSVLEELKRGWTRKGWWLAEPSE